MNLIKQSFLYEDEIMANNFLKILMKLLHPHKNVIDDLLAIFLNLDAMILYLSEPINDPY